jgi:hypothetical protein
MAAQERQIIIPVTVTVAKRPLEIPITVTVGLDDLVGIVVEHLNTGTDIRQLLVAHYAQQYMEEEPAPDPAPRNGRKKPEPADFTEEELASVDLDAQPRWSGKGKKSRPRLLWEAAMHRAGRAF